MGTNMSARRNIQLLMVALSVLLSAACTKIAGPGDEGWTELQSGRQVRFSSSLATTATKATSTLPDNTTFGVFAFYQEGTPGSAGSWNNNRTPNFMFNQAVEFRLPDSYTYTPLSYWPSNEYNTLSFWAYCPYSATPDLLTRGSTNAYTSASKNIPDIRFSSDGHTDLMVSDIVTNQTYSSQNGVVPLTFSHVLSKIDVKAEKVDSEGKYTVTLDAVSFKGLYGTAILRNQSGNWELTGSRQDEVWRAAPTPSPELAHETATNIGSAILLPQDLSNDASRLQVEYSVSYTEGGTTHSYSTVRQAYLRDVFYSIGGGSWTKNSHYVVTLKITPGNPIQFTVSWDTWGADHNYHLSS